jgi:hypothetical protein
LIPAFLSRCSLAMPRITPPPSSSWPIINA